jgi:putative membrane protein insertion efficiency factor
LLTVPIRTYQLLVSPVLGSNCRYTQSCSSYAIEAIDRHGPLRGTGLALGRIMRCNPWHPGGHDPVPGSLDRERPLR